ncbi:hypothetical protein AL035_01995 [Salipiger aestuarii]|uniref:Uncharacterized protein n=1 Tax=Salipiger aestuarii TaxID=568098 RepID=A0A327YT34_9RHOB|nr:hypothetical protein [Salipiger aestuarii]KAB2543260.1 hypothetical protein AL035_01995 [Salipiger aestuarii]RAK24083.1 hypothetical protein ATI53_1001190 [Salipiger aestuarii]
MTDIPHDWPARTTPSQRAAYRAFANLISAAEDELAARLLAEAPAFGITVHKTDLGVNLQGVNGGAHGGNATGALHSWRMRYQDTQP